MSYAKRGHAQSGRRRLSPKSGILRALLPGSCVDLPSRRVSLYCRTLNISLWGSEHLLVAVRFDRSLMGEAQEYVLHRVPTVYVEACEDLLHVIARGV